MTNIDNFINEEAKTVEQVQANLTAALDECAALEAELKAKPFSSSWIIIKKIIAMG